MSFLYNVFRGGKRALELGKKTFSKKQPTITGMKPTTGTKDKQAYQFNLMKNKLKNQMNKLKGDK